MCGRPWSYTVAVVAAALASGCDGSEIYPVSGRVVHPDGTPAVELRGARVVFEGVGPDGKGYSAEGEIDRDGRFEMTTARPGDGAVVGRNRVLIGRRTHDPERVAPRVIPGKYENFATSGLKVEVRPQRNTVTLTVEPLKKK